jgi:hypothetical protein
MQGGTMSGPLGDGPIKFQFIVGGGPFLDFEYRIIGGPDDGKRLTSFPENDVAHLEANHTYYNGPKEEYMKRYVLDRPRWRPHFWTYSFSPETIEAASLHFGKLCPVYQEWHEKYRKEKE